MHDLKRAGGVVRFGVFEVDVRARELRKHGRRIRIQDKPFEILFVLLERPGQIVSRDELQRRLWPSGTFVVFDDSLNTAVRKAREALGDSAESPQFIETVPRHGYRFIGSLDDNGNNGDVAAFPQTAPAIAPPRSGRKVAAGVAIAAIGAIAVIAAPIWLIVRSGASHSDVVRFQIRPPEGTHFPAGAPRVAISPDGRKIAFVAVSRPDLTRQVWVQSLDSTDARPISGTEAAWDPFWSPSGREIAFVSFRMLRRLDPQRRVVVPLADAADADGAWSEASGILFPRGPGHGLYRIAASGGAAEPATTLDRSRGETQHLFPQFLPDGRSFIYLAMSSRAELSAIYLARLGETGRRRVLDNGRKAMYAAPGILVFVRDSRLFAQRFDADKALLYGDAVEVASGVPSNEATGRAGFSVSAHGPLAYAGDTRLPRRELVWLNRSGRRVAVVGQPDFNRSTQLSPDRGWMAIERADPDVATHPPDVWLVDLARGVQSRLTTSRANDESPVWAPDSQKLVYARHRAIREAADLYIKDRMVPEEDRPLLVDDTGSKHPSDWSADGRFILYDMEDATGTRNIWLLPVAAGGAKPVLWLATPADEWRARFSPNGRWVAYESNETGRPEIFVRSFDRPAEKWPISATGGTQPRWRHDGGELYYVSADYQMMAVPVRSNGTFSAETPRPLFELRRLASIPYTETPYDVSADGQRFLVGAVVDEGGDAPITVVLNWSKLLERRP